MNQTMADGFGHVNSPTAGGDYGNYGNHAARNTKNNFFVPNNSKYNQGRVGPSNAMNATAYGAAGFGQFRNKSNGAKLSQYQGVHGTI